MFGCFFFFYCVVSLLQDPVGGIREDVRKVPTPRVAQEGGDHPPVILHDTEPQIAPDDGTKEGAPYTVHAIF